MEVTISLLPIRAPNPCPVCHAQVTRIPVPQIAHGINQTFLNSCNSSPRSDKSNQSLTDPYNDRICKCFLIDTV
ncbi:hypothetical protein GmHk_12G035234 [Glycine max]|uniref:Uncharacterized protein n=1 Tax=Glycine max TaxID=3847 RepID=A0A0R0E512_SOYBN|nr:hypothetical protein GYH30_057251 [Glycine max]KAH1221932.1 hypothetical protein GmHk_12G035234 [Glycine max]